MSVSQQLAKIDDPTKVYRITYTDQQKIGGRYRCLGDVTVEGTARYFGTAVNGAVSVSDPTTGRQIVMIAGALVRNVEVAS